MITEKKIIFLLLVLCLFLGGVAYFSNIDGNQCMNAPFTYGAEKYSEANNMNLDCTCNFFSPTAETPTIKFDRHNFEVLFKGIPITDDFNFSLVE